MEVSERQIEMVFVRAVEARGGLAPKFISPGWRGAPDRVVILPGCPPFFVELKAPGGRLHPLQRRRARELEARGATVRVVASIDDIAELLAEVCP